MEFGGRCWDLSREVENNQLLGKRKNQRDIIFISIVSRGCVPYSFLSWKHLSALILVLDMREKRLSVRHGGLGVEAALKHTRVLLQPEWDE